ncbi:MAG: DNA repair protein RecO, partial [Faecalibacterium sp.]|nr:DNA repair protein RecO [Faecalibacterium sp.]
MEPFVTMGLVLKETRYREADRILTILTPKLGVITAMAANSLRLKSKLFSACGLFCYSEFTLVPGRNMYTVREADVQNIFHGISSSIEGVSLAMYLTELAAALSPTGEEAARELRLVLNSLYMISEHRTDLRVVKAVFELKVMCLAGYLPDLSGCAVCGDPEPDRFDVRGGILCCASCSAGEGLRLPVSPGSLAAMRYLVSCDAKRLFAFRLEGRAVKEL